MQSAIKDGRLVRDYEESDHVEKSVRMTAREIEGGSSVLCRGISIGRTTAIRISLE